MSITSNKSEKHWALKSTNLKRIEDDPKNQTDIYVKSRPRNNYSNQSTLTNIRKSSYPVLPGLFTNRNESSQSFDSKESLNTFDLDSANTSDYGSDPSPRYQKPVPQKVIDNKSYHGLSHQKYPNFESNTNTFVKKRNGERNSKTFVLRTENQQISLSRNRNGMNLHLFHAIQSISLEIIDETLEDEVIIDVMIDAFKEIQNEVEQFNVMIAPVVRLTADDILSEAIDKIIHETVLMSLMKDSKSQLRAQMVSRWTLDDIMKPLLAEVTHDAVRELANDKMMIVRSIHVFNKLSDDFIHDYLRNSGKSLIVEVMLELILDEQVIFPVIEDSLRNTADDILEYYHQKINRINLQQINSIAMEKPLASLMIAHLVSVGVRQKAVYGPSFVAQYLFENFVFDILLDKTEEIYDKLANTIESRSICHFHQETNQTIVSDCLLSELIEYSDADLCDLDAEEVQEPYIPRYIGQLDKAIYSNSRPN